MGYLDVFPLVVIIGGFLTFAVILATVSTIENRRAKDRS